MSAILGTTFTVARYTVRDLIRQKILYNIFFVSIFLLFFGYLAALLVFGHQDRVMLHFGMMVNALSVFAVAASAGARTVRSEIEQRTAYLPLSRPLSRTRYYYGKWLGIIAFTAINMSLLTGILLYGLKLTGGAPNLAFLQASFLIWCETTLVSAFALLLSLFLRQGLSTMACIAYLFVSHNHEQFEFLKEQGSEPGFLVSLVRLFSPDAQLLLLDTKVYYDMPLTLFEFSKRFGYGLLWAALFMIIGNAFFSRKNL